MTHLGRRATVNLYSRPAHALWYGNRVKNKWTKAVSVATKEPRPKTDDIGSSKNDGSYPVIEVGRRRNRVWISNEAKRVAEDRWRKVILNPDEERKDEKFAVGTRTMSTDMKTSDMKTSDLRSSQLISDKTKAASSQLDLSERKRRRTSLEFVSKYALKRKSACITKTVPVTSRKTVNRKPAKPSLISRYKWMKRKSVDSKLSTEKSQANSETTSIPRNTSLPSKSVKKHSLVDTSHHNISTKSVSGRNSLKAEHKSRFKLVRLRTPSSSRLISREAGVSHRPAGLPCVRSRHVQRLGSCEKRVTRYKIIRVRKKNLNSVLNGSFIKWKSQHKLVKAKQPCRTSMGRLSVYRRPRKQTSPVINHKLSRQLIRTDDGMLMLKGRFHLVKSNGGRLLRQQMAGSVHKKTSFRLSLEPRVRRYQVTVQAAAHKLVRRSLSLVRAAHKRGSKCSPKKLCMFYNKFGRCRRGTACHFIHDPDKVAVCTKFLRGLCDKTDDSCLFSHTVSKDKMPVCSFFLRGRCSNDNCPYSHVRVGEMASVCEDFLNGYCPEGQKV
jgi:hypothetical protein